MNQVVSIRNQKQNNHKPNEINTYLIKTEIGNLQSWKLVDLIFFLEVLEKSLITKHTKQNIIQKWRFKYNRYRRD